MAMAMITIIIIIVISSDDDADDVRDSSCRILCSATPACGGKQSG